jgi:hypothetical protein
MSASSFIPGIKLCELFYGEAVQPILGRHFPELKHAAALIGDGSEVLGFDDELSTDHDWGPRVMLFVREEDQQFSEQIIQALAQELPYEFHGYPTHWTDPDMNDNGTQALQSVQAGPVNHRVTAQTIHDFILEHLGFDIRQDLEPADWLTFSEQRLLTLTSGGIYHDEVGLEEQLSRFAYYPRDVWLYLLAAGWSRIGEDEHLMGRAGMVGDEVGSAIIGARLVRDIMRLCFLMEKTYAPYPKWFGTAFKRLPGARELWPVLQGALCADHWQQREGFLVKAYEQLAIRHNALNLTRPFPEQTISFFGRPFQVMELHGFSGALMEQIEDPRVKRIAAQSPMGSLDLLSDNTNLVSNPRWRRLIRHLYE